MFLSRWDRGGIVSVDIWDRGRRPEPGSEESKIPAQPSSLLENPKEEAGLLLPS
jgi:hypothetical protein